MVTAVEEFKRNPDLKEEDLKHVKDWISKQPHLPQNITDEMIIIIMHSCYYSLELSKHTIDEYFTLRTHLPEFFTNRDLQSEDVKEIYKTVNMIPLEGSTKEGYKVMLVGLKRTEPQFYNLYEAFKLFNMVADATINKEGTSPGLIIVVDFTGMKLGHLAKLTLPAMKKLLTYLQDGLPVRLKGMHYINVVPFIDKVLLLMKPFMKKELMDMLVLHTEGSESVYEVVPKDLFPNELGGSAGSIDVLRERTYKFVEGYQEWYKKDELIRVDETKRPGKAKSAGQLFGVDGSFRKLTID